MLNGRKQTVLGVFFAESGLLMAFAVDLPTMRTLCWHGSCDEITLLFATGLGTLKKIILVALPSGIGVLRWNFSFGDPILVDLIAENLQRPSKALQFCVQKKVTVCHDGTSNPPP
ncbi:hypothetical protein [Deinococcus misasensis]|uniref:hypothetical protein n=1 Tax=Deinococcus misasensis TaxID=392413 RepID=UPI0012FB3F1F|nr:hypothetical protein [Deinococcus misasensis]